MFDYEQIIKDITVEETEDGFRIEIKGNKEWMKAAGFPERLMHFHERMQRFSERGSRGWWRGRGQDHGPHGHHRGHQGGHHGRHHGPHGEQSEHPAQHWARRFDPKGYYEPEEKPKRKRGDRNDDVYYV